MFRERSTPRPDWVAKCHAVGFDFHSMDGTYWDESACYRFNADQIDCLEAATAELHGMCLQAAGELIRLGAYDRLAIPDRCASLIEQSWRARQPSLYGRFDFSYDGRGEPRLLEYNADTPTSILEASVVQWHWMRELHPGADQFNSLHERLIECWKAVANAGSISGPIHFACVRGSDEDFGNVEYLRDTAQQAGLDTRLIFIDDIGWSDEDRCFADTGKQRIDALFKLYPWEWLVREEFGTNILPSGALFIEPPWKMLLSNKGLLAALWELFPGHPNLLPAYLEPGRIHGDHVRKPLLSREGANVSFYSALGERRSVSAGSYGSEGFVYQAAHPLPDFDGNHAVIGSWIVGDDPAGIGIREDAGPITTNASRFVPHYFA